jgi:endoglucanase
MIQGMRDSGFKSLRIPVAWTNAMNFTYDDFMTADLTINPAYFDRVEEIINYALDADMFVIVNDHWDHGWWSMFGSVDLEVRERGMELFTSMWTQIAERYNHFDARVIFESANEELGDRLNDSTHFTNGRGVLTQDECYEMTYVINQTFVDIVRESGGNNAERFLLVKGYNTDFTRTSDDRFKMPSDPANKLLLGIHYYTPWSYCGDTSGVGGWGTIAEVEEMDELFGRIAKFADMGYGIVLGEWGVLDNHGEDRFNYYTHFLRLCDLYGHAPFLWDGQNIYSRVYNTIRAKNDEDDFIDHVITLFNGQCVTARGHMTIAEIKANAEADLVISREKAKVRPQFEYTADEAFAWIMFASDDWAVQYSVGDQYRPESMPDGLIATDVEIFGEGTYTVALDFTGTGAGRAEGIAFSAVGIVNGEILFPGYIMQLKEVLINGERAQLVGVPYTTNDNPVTTRVNLFNVWVPDDDLPEEARTHTGMLTGATAQPLINYLQTTIYTLEVTFDYYPN